MDSKKLPWGLVWRDEKLAKTELQKAGKEGRRGLIAVWAPSLLLRKVPCTQCGTWTHRCVDEHYWHTMPDSSLLGEVVLYLHAKGNQLPALGCWEAAVVWKQKKGNSMLCERRKGWRTGAHQGGYLPGAIVEPLWNAKVSCKHNREPKVTLKKRSARKQQRKKHTASSRNIGAFSLKAFMKMACNSVLM